MSSYPGKLGYIPALDGLRGVAILLVMLHHAFVMGFQPGYLGVDIFFALSGFLITSIVVQEHFRTGKVDLFAFYKRRALRLLPALFAVILFALLLTFLFGTPSAQTETMSQAIAVTFYVANWREAWQPILIDNPLAVTWSLSIEDQFYILWAPLLVLALAYHIKMKTTIMFVSLFALISMLLAALLAAAYVNPSRALSGTDTRAHALLIGCIAALVFTQSKVPISSVSTRILWLLCLPGPLFYVFMAMRAIFYDDNTRALSISGGITLVALSTSALVLLIVSERASVVGRMLAWRPLVWTGSVSYGLYLWHSTIFWFVNFGPLQADSSLLRGLAFLLSFVVAAISYRYIEKPFLRLKYANTITSNKPVIQPEVS